MYRLALVGFYRSLARHKVQAALDIGGLAVGIAVFLVLMLYVRFETSYERWLPSYNDIYLVESRTPGSTGGEFRHNTPAAFWSAVERDIPGAVGTRIRERDAAVITDGIGVSERIGLVDPSFSKVFELPMVAGDLSRAFGDPAGIALTTTAAHKYFGPVDPIGKPIEVVYGGQLHVYRVAAVMQDLPKNTAFDFDMLARLEISSDGAAQDYKSDNRWDYASLNTYVRASDEAAAHRFAHDLPGIVARHAQTETAEDPNLKIEMRMQPLADVHGESAGVKQAVATLGIVGLLTLLIAVANYVNLATARARLRTSEVATRKVLGANSATLARHYVGEAIGTTAIAGYIGLVIAEIGLPLVNAAGGMQLSITYLGSKGILLPLFILVLTVGITAGIYPAIMMARMPASASLATARLPGGGRTGTLVREVLVIFQFTIAVTFVIAAVVLFAQIHHVRNADVGYERAGLLLVRSIGSQSLSDARRDAIFARLSKLPGVTSATASNNVPGPEPFVSESRVSVPGVPGDGPWIRSFETTPGFFDVMHARLRAGRAFDPRYPADITLRALPENASKPMNLPYDIVVNRTALAALHVSSPQSAIGRTFTSPDNPPRTIVGVVDNMRFDDPRTPIPPTMYEFVQRDPEDAIAILRFSGDPEIIMDEARTVWRLAAPGVPFQAETATQSLESFYEHDNHTARIFAIGAVLAVLIGLVGLWGLASFNTARRIKEIGIRKTLGASSTDVVVLLVGHLLRPMLIANLFAWAIAFFAMRSWLSGFDERIALSPLFFVSATLLVLLIAVLTIIVQSFRAARSTPGWALRHE